MRSHLCVYTFRAADGAVLYVGLSSRIADRLARHSRRKDWWTEVTSIDLTHCESHAEMLETEARLIRELEPIHNVQQNRPDRNRLPVDGWEVAAAEPDGSGRWTVTYRHPEHDRAASSTSVVGATAEEAARNGLERWRAFAAAVAEERVR